MTCTAIAKSDLGADTKAASELLRTAAVTVPVSAAWLAYNVDSRYDRRVWKFSSSTSGQNACYCCRHGHRAQVD